MKYDRDLKIGPEDVPPSFKPLPKKFQYSGRRNDEEPPVITSAMAGRYYNEKGELVTTRGVAVKP